MKSKDDEASSTEEDWDVDEKEESTEEKKEIKIKSPKVNKIRLVICCKVFFFFIYTLFGQGVSAV